TDDAQRNLPAVGYQYFFEHVFSSKYQVTSRKYQVTMSQNILLLATYDLILSLRFDKKKRLIIFYRRCIVCQYLHDLAAYLAFNFIKQLHSLHNTDHLT